MSRSDTTTYYLFTITSYFKKGGWEACFPAAALPLRFLRNRFIERAGDLVPRTHPLLLRHRQMSDSEK